MYFFIGFPKSNMPGTRFHQEVKSTSFTSSVGPFGNPLGLAELDFGEFGSLGSVACIDFDTALADFILTSVVAKHFFQELDDEVGHEFAIL